MIPASVTAQQDEVLLDGDAPSSELSEDELWLHEECEELFNHFNHKCLDAILRATKLSLDFIRKRVFFTA